MPPVLSIVQISKWAKIFFFGGAGFHPTGEDYAKFLLKCFEMGTVSKGRIFKRHI